MSSSVFITGFIASQKEVANEKEIECLCVIFCFVLMRWRCILCEQVFCDIQLFIYSRWPWESDGWCRYWITLVFANKSHCSYWSNEWKLCKLDDERANTIHFPWDEFLVSHTSSIQYFREKKGKNKQYEYE